MCYTDIILNKENQKMTKMYEKSEFVDGKGYFKCYKCKHCGYEKGTHHSITKACPDDLRKTHPSYSGKNVYEENVKKPVFVKVVI